MAEQMVPNPRRTGLTMLLAEVEERCRDVRQAYQYAVAAMRSGRVWTGPTAVGWRDDLEARHHRLAWVARCVTDAIEEELHRQPPLVTEAEADAIRREMAERT